MQPEQHQRIVYYFIEEANEHLGTIQQGLSDLRSTVADSERLGDVYRAAHSIKGGAAMLGMEPIQKVAHCLEDGFKFFREHAGALDSHLETILGDLFHGLRSLLEQLQTPAGLTDQITAETMAQLDPKLIECRAHLGHLLAQDQTSVPHEVTATLGIDIKHVEMTDSEVPVHVLGDNDALGGLDINLSSLDLELLSTDASWEDPIATPFNSEFKDSEVGTTELGSLASLFEGDVPDLELFHPQGSEDLVTGLEELSRSADLDELLFTPPSLSLDVADFATGVTPAWNELTDPASNTSDFEDLETLLGASTIDEGDSIDDLTSFLNELSEGDASPMGAFEVADRESNADAIALDVGADLESLISGNSDSTQPIGGSQTLLPSSVDSDFKDLERLLGDAEQQDGRSNRSRSSSASGRAARSGSIKKAPEQTMRVPIKQLDSLNNLVGELVVNRNSLEQDQERMRQFLDNLLYQVQQINDAGQRMRDLYERSLLEISLLAGRKSRTAAVNGGASTGVQSSSSSTDMAFDALEMDRFSGFHLLAQDMIELIVRIRESSSDIEFVVDEMEQVTRMFRQSTSQIQESLTRSRMIPFAQIADRLPRAVRDISIKSGKQAELFVEGRDTLIDKMILEQLYDPMTHLVNNAIAHGIETPDIRQATDKDASGRIMIRAFHQGNQTIISISDDGAGIDSERVKAKAIERGLITAAQAETLSQVEVYDLLFQPGFSTRDQADDFAGRGVGMDVVRTALNEIRGDVITDSVLGKGTTFTIRLPLTLSISKALCCVSSLTRIAFPMDGVEDVLDIPSDQVQTDETGAPCVKWREGLLPFKPLNELLRFNRQLGRGTIYGTNSQEDVVSIIVLRSANNIVAVQVDQVLGEQEIVIKQLEGPAPKPTGIAGATIQGDGRVMAIADVLELIDIGMGRVRRDMSTLVWAEPAMEPVPAKTEPMVLIVDDSITVRELLSMTFNKIGYRVEQARDGQEAWDKLRAGLPCDIIFCDIEMPRMDGLELLSRVQKDPNLSHLPIAMLTSRGADRHRQLAAQLGASGYFTKPYLEEALLDAAQRMLKGEVLLTAAST
jgi:chemotaxis protein histidine kinase CheA/ActR/RegA family two-component response regulator